MVRADPTLSPDLEFTEVPALEGSAAEGSSGDFSSEAMTGASGETSGAQAASAAAEVWSRRVPQREIEVRAAGDVLCGAGIGGG